MTLGANRSRARKRLQIRIPSGKSVLRYREKKPGSATCPSGRSLPGTVRGNANTIAKYSKTQRRPSRPYGGVLSSPVMREVLRARASEGFEAPTKTGSVYAVGAVCMKVAGRDAGKLCVVTEVLDNQFVKVDGYTRPRKVNVNHLEPLGKQVDVKKGADSKAVQAALSA